MTSLEAVEFIDWLKAVQRYSRGVGGALCLVSRGDGRAEIWLGEVGSGGERGLMGLEVYEWSLIMD